MLNDDSKIEKKNSYGNKNIKDDKKQKENNKNNIDIDFGY